MNIEKQKLIIYNVFIGIILGLVIAINCVASYWNQALLLYLGTTAGQVMNYHTDYKEDEQLRETQEQLVREIVDEGSILLKNESNTLPLNGDENITLFGQCSVLWSNSGVGSVKMADQQNMTLKESFENCGFHVNDTIWNYYSTSNKKPGSGGAGQSANWKLNETDWLTLKNNAGTSFNTYKDAAVVVFSRVGCEGGDLPRYMDKYDGLESENYLELSTVEKDILKGIKAEGFEKTIVILKAGNAMQVDFLDDALLGVNSCIWIGSTGDNGVEEVGKIIKGEINPSGHLPDTMTYDSYSSPAMQNFGDFRYVDESGSPLLYNYINYSEGIYVGYKYYETRYEDVVTNRENVGSFDYSKTVKYPFGYGGSYTTFAYSNMKVSYKNDTATVTVNVKNTGSRSGKDAVQVYLQSPYTTYDISNKVEKSSVKLVGILKTKELNPNESYNVDISFDLNEMMKSYDYVNAKSYIIDDGDYYFAVGENSHDALNNILALKGYSTSNGMDYNGDKTLAVKYNQSDFEKIEYDEVTNYKVTNQFDDAILNDAKYLSRNNWKMMDDDGLRYADGTLSGISYNTNLDGFIYTKEISADILAAVKNISFTASGIPESEIDKSEVISEKASDLKFGDMKGVAYDDPLWDELVQELTIAELHTLYNTAGYGTKKIEVINLPTTYDYDGPFGLTSYVSDWSSFSYPNTNMLAATFNVKLAERMGKLVAEDGIRANVSGWYAPAMNIHRSNFSGRNNEYYSEDPILSGLIGSNTVLGARSKGMTTFIKHFAVNDQETERSRSCNWLSEQALREVYLKPFEMSVKYGGSNGLMASMNKIGTRITRGSYPLLTTVLRNEWGFKGATITDFTSSAKEYSDMAIAAGIDLQLNTTPNKLTTTKTPEMQHALQKAAKHTLYMIANSFVMNAFDDGTISVDEGYPIWKVIVYSLDAVTVLSLGTGELFVVLTFLRKRKEEKILKGI